MSDENILVNNINTEYQCRICLENDDIDNLIYPCKCKGSSKFVHKSCLNEWRTTSTNRENFNRCELCHYQYVVSSNEIEPNNDNCCTNKYRVLISQPAIFYTLYFLFVFLCAQIIGLIDNYSLNNDGEEFSDIYFVLSTSLLLVLQCLTVFYWFMRVKNKRLYCKLYYEKKDIILGALLIASFLSLIFGWMVGIFLIELVAFRMFQIHFYSIDRLSRLNLLEIQNYVENTIDIVTE